MGLLDRLFRKVGNSHIEALKRDLMNAKDGRVRYQAAKRLTQVGRPAVPILIEALKHESPGTRQAAAIALGEIGDLRATLPLLAVLRDVGWAAAEALGKIGDPRAEKVLQQTSQDFDDAELRSSARDALAKMRGGERTQVIVKLVDQILTYSADAQVGEVLAFIGEKDSRPMRAYQRMEDAALELHRLQQRLTDNERDYLNERLRELDQHDDWNVRRCAEIIREGK